MSEALNRTEVIPQVKNISTLLYFNFPGTQKTYIKVQSNGNIKEQFLEHGFTLYALLPQYNNERQYTLGKLYTKRYVNKYIQMRLLNIQTCLRRVGNKSDKLCTSHHRKFTYLNSIKPSKWLIPQSNFPFPDSMSFSKCHYICFFLFFFFCFGGGGSKKIAKIFKWKRSNTILIR